MCKPHKALCVLLPVLLPAILTMACSFSICGLGTEPTPTPIPPTSTPRPSPTPLPSPTSTPELLADTFTSENLGVSVGYPDGWTADEELGQVVLATSKDYDPTEKEGAAFAFFADPAEEFDATTLEDLWDDMAGTLEADIGDVEPLEFGGVDGLRGTFEDEEEDLYGWMAVAFANDYGYIFIAVTNPSESWGDYEDIFDAMAASVEFFPPAGVGEPPEGPAGELTSRDDVPLPPDAEVILDLPEILGYMTDAAVTDAAGFMEDNWPDYGWEADTDNILYMVDEENGLLFFTKGGEVATVAISIDEDSGKTQVSIIIAAEEP